jgi:hypothetical protein
VAQLGCDQVGLKWSCLLGQVCGLAKMHLVGVVAGTPAGLLDTQIADDLDIHDAARIQRFSPPQV